MARNEPLMESMKELVRLAAELMKKDWRAEPGRSTLHCPIRRRNSWLILRCARTLKDSAPWRAAVEVLLGTPELAKHFGVLVGIPGMGYRLELDQVLPSFILENFSRANRCEFDPEVCDTLYTDFEYLLYEPTIPMLTTAPLLGVEAACPKIDLIDGVSIVTLPPREAPFRVDELLGTSGDGTFSIALRHQVASFLEIRSDERKMLKEMDSSDRPFYSEKMWTTINTVMDAMRVHKPGTVSAPVWEQDARIWGPMTGRSRRIQGSIPTHVRGELYYLQADDAQPIGEYMRQIRVCRDSGGTSLTRSLNWFSKAAEEEDLEDRLIALMIAAEAFYLQDTNSESTYRLSQRVALYLEQDAKARQELSSFTKKAYDLRSKLVHGSAVGKGKGGKNVDLPGTVTRFESVMRRSLQKALLADPADRPTENKELWDQLVFSK